MIRKKKCRDCGNAITHNTVCARIVVLSTPSAITGIQTVSFHTAGTDYCGPADYCQRQCVLLCSW